MIQRWIHLLANFSFSVEHRSGTKHGNADGLSRAPHAKEHPEILLTDDTILSIHNISEPSWTPKFLKEAQLEDPDISFLFKILSEKSTISKELFTSLSKTGQFYAELLDSLKIDKNGIIRYSFTVTNEMSKLPKELYLLPERLIQSAVIKAHLQVSHMALQATYNKLIQHAFFPNMKKRI